MTKEAVTSSSDDDQWSDFRLDWLFDLDRQFDLLPIDEQVKMYKSRDLRAGKCFNYAVKIFGPAGRRTRRTIAPPMETLQRHVVVASGKWDRTSADYNVKLTSGGQENITAVTRNFQKQSHFNDCLSNITPQSHLNLRKPLMSPSQPILVKSVGDDESVSKYRSWMEERRKLRNQLDSVAVNADWLARKPNKTAIEERVLMKLIDERNAAAIRQMAPTKPNCNDDTSPEVRKGDLPRIIPFIKRPSPAAVKVLETYLFENKLRMIDLFQCVDKNKDWKITTEEFRKIIKQNRIPLKNSDLEDLMTVFEKDDGDERYLDYRDLIRSMEIWKLEKFEIKKNRQKSASAIIGESSDEFSHLMGFDMLPKGANINSQLRTRPNTTPKTNVRRSCETLFNRNSAQPRTDLTYLLPPTADLRGEDMANTDEFSVDTRWRNQHLLRIYKRKLTSKASKPLGDSNEENKKTMISTGDVIIDKHCSRSTLGGESADSVDEQRQQLLREYYKVSNSIKPAATVNRTTCSRTHVSQNHVTPLQRAFFCPGDLPHSKIVQELKKKNRKKQFPDK